MSKIPFHSRTPVHLRILRSAGLAGSAAVVLAAPLAPARAQAPAALAPGLQGQPQQKFTPQHIALAREVMNSSGIARSFDAMLPAFADQVKRATVTRPEIQKDLDDVLVKLQPELELQKQEMVNTAAQIYASRMSEADLSQVATFFRTPAGKNYVETQPQVLDDMVQAMQSWTQQVSEYVVVRVRSEMSKRGHSMQ